MERKFTHNGENLITRVTEANDQITAAVHEGNGRRRYGLTVPSEDWPQVEDHLGNSAQGLADHIEGEYKRYVDEVLPAIRKAEQDQAAR